MNYRYGSDGTGGRGCKTVLRPLEKNSWALDKQLLSLGETLLGRKVMTNLDSILKSRDITLSTMVCLVKALVFPVVIYGCES